MKQNLKKWLQKWSRSLSSLFMFFFVLVSVFSLSGCSTKELLPTEYDHNGEIVKEDPLITAQKSMSAAQQQCYAWAVAEANSFVNIVGGWDEDRQLIYLMTKEHGVTVRALVGKGDPCQSQGINIFEMLAREVESKNQLAAKGMNAGIKLGFGYFIQEGVKSVVSGYRDGMGDRYMARDNGVIELNDSKNTIVSTDVSRPTVIGDGTIDTSSTHPVTKVEPEEAIEEPEPENDVEEEQ